MLTKHIKKASPSTQELLLWEAGAVGHAKCLEASTCSAGQMTCSAALRTGTSSGST